MQSQRSDGNLTTLAIVPWLEIPREERYRERVAAAATGEPGVVSALRAYLASGADVPEPWLSLAFDERVTIFDYLDAESLVVLDEPGMLDTLDRSLDDERSREQAVLLAGVDSGELDVRASEVGEALLAEVTAPYPHLATLGPLLAAHRTLILTGGIESVEYLRAAGFD